MSFFEELRRRNVLRVAFAYLVVGWLLTEVLTTILPALGAPEWMSRAVVLLFAFGFIPAVVFSWLFQITPDGVKRQHEVDESAPTTRRMVNRLSIVTVAAVVILLVTLALLSARQTSQQPLLSTPVTTASVAVLPFVNLSNERDNEYFSDGLTETLLHMLAQIPDLKVAARTSSFAFKNQNKTIREIAAALDVAHVLEGSVQRAGNRVRITAQLIRADDGFHIWSESYDRTLDDIFAIQDEIAERVGGALSASLLPTRPDADIEGVTTEDPDAYDLYLQALKQRATYSYGGLQASENLLKGALVIDPDFNDAKTALAYNFLQQMETGLMLDTRAYAEIRAITDQVLNVAPDNIPAQAIRLFADTMMQGKQGEPEAFFDAIAQLDDLLRGNPEDLEVRILLVRLLEGTKQFERARDLLREALAGDPLNPRIHYELGSIYARLNQHDRARRALLDSLEIEPAQPNAYAKLARLGLHDNDGVEFIQQFLKAIEVDPRDHELPGIVAGFLYELELIDEGDDFRNRVLAIAPTSEIAFRIELQRALSANDEEASLASARRAIVADVDDRRFAFGGAVQYLLRAAARNDSLADEFAWLESRYPGMFDIDAPQAPLKHRVAQFAAIDAWYQTVPKPELERRLDSLLDWASAYGMDPENEPMTRLAMLALRGDTKAATEVALKEVFTEPVAVHLGWERSIAQAQYSDLVADPRIQQAMQRWTDDEATLRDEVRTYLSDLQARR